jgi:hypothetical protein
MIICVLYMFHVFKASIEEWPKPGALRLDMALHLLKI